MKRLISLFLIGVLGASVAAYGQIAKPNSGNRKPATRKGSLPLSAPRKTASAICNIPCCDEQFPYEFCNPTDGSISVKCSTNPNDDPANGAPAKAFIPSCVVVDPMPDNATWQPTGPPPQPAGVLSNYELGDNTNEESGASAQQANDAVLFYQIPSQPPADPDFESNLYPVTSDPGPEPSCGDSAPYPDPQPPDRQSIFNRYVNYGFTDNNYIVPPWLHPYDYQWQNYWDDDETEYDAAMAQWSLDSSNFLNGFDTAHYDQTGYDDNAITSSNWYFNTDYGWLWDEYDFEYASYDSEIVADSAYEACLANLPDEISQWEQDTASYSKYLGAEAQYQADLFAWNNSANSYIQVFDQSEAQLDAQEALDTWLNTICNPPIQPCESDPPCCIHVVMDDNVRDFPPDNVVETDAQTTGSGPNTFLTCQPQSCENSEIEVNVTTEFLGAERQSDANADDSSAYSLRTVRATEFYTGSTPPVTASGYDCFSFFQLMLHEIGHYLGLHHPEEVTDGDTCKNCYTANPFWTPSNGVNTSGYRTVMAENNNVPNQISLVDPELDPMITLSGEDECQFQKLYCNTCGGGSGTSPCAYDDGVSAPNSQPDWFNPNIFPNPSSGGMTLTYSVRDRSFVQVRIYDMLGHEIREVSAAYAGPGPKSISLGTESLPSGQYVCRVRVGENVAYINLVIKK